MMYIACQMKIRIKYLNTKEEQIGNNLRQNKKADLLEGLRFVIVALPGLFSYLFCNNLRIGKEGQEQRTALELSVQMGL